MGRKWNNIKEKKAALQEQATQEAENPMNRNPKRKHRPNRKRKK